MGFSALIGSQGEKILGPGVESQIALGVAGDANVSQVHGDWYTIAKRGKLYTAVTAVGGVDHGAAKDTAAPFALFNPGGSGKDLVILKATMAYISGTLGAGAIYLCANKVTTEAPPTGTPITILPGLLTGSAGIATAWTTATLPSTPNALLPVFSVAPLLASSVVQPYVAEMEFKGGIIVPPGCGVSLQGVCGAAGTSPRVVFGMVWEEITA